MNATTAARTTGQRGSARVAIVALVFIVAAAVAGLATGTLLQQAINRAGGTVLSTEAYDSLHAMHAIEAAAAAGLSAALATEAYGHDRVQALTGPAISDWPDVGARMATPKLISDTFRFTGPSRVQSAGLAAALATEAYGIEHVQRITAASAPTISDWPDLGSRMVTQPLITDTFRLAGPSRVENAGLNAALATEAYGTLHVLRMLEAGNAAPAITEWPDEASRLIKPAPVSDTFRLTGGSRVE